MTRPDKHAARFGDDFWRIPTYADVDPRKVVRALRSFRPVVARVTQNIHAVRERWTYTPHVANMAAPTVAELEAGTPIRGISAASFGTHSGGDVVDINTTDGTGVPWDGSAATTIVLASMWRSPVDDQPDIIDRIDDTLLTYDSQRTTGEQPWPYREF